MRFIAICLAILAAAPTNSLAQSPRTHDERQTLGVLFRERHVPDSALAVHRQAAAMPLEQRYAYLLNWVVPGPDHSTLRLALDYTPTHPSPPAADDDPVDARRLQIAATKQQSSIPTGGNLVSPALDLIEAARELGRLDVLRKQVEQAPTTDDYARRSRLAMLALIDVARGDVTPAVDAMFQLFELVEAGQHSRFHERWPETLTVYGGLRHPTTREAARDMAFHLYFAQTRSGADSGSEAWRRQMLVQAGLAKHFELKISDNSLEHFTTAPELRWWSPVTRTTARSRGLGYPSGHWQIVDGRADCLGAHDDDYLYYRSPLRGNFEIECDLPAFGWRDMQIAIGGHWAAVSYDLKSYSVGGFRSTRPRAPITPPLASAGDWLHYRIVVRDSVARTSVNGRMFHEEPLTEDFDPWLGIRNNVYSTGSARNFRIMGSPEIPAEVRLSALADLRGWLPYYDHDIVGVDWRQTGDPAAGGGITGLRRHDVDGAFLESLLRYHRPMLEDGTIEYEFYYRQGEAHCHPAIDRLALLLDPVGVRIHWITDGRFDRTGLTADNAVEEPAARRGSEQLPLRDDDWNHVAFTLRGDTIDVVLNGQLVFQRQLEPTNQRTFGLFHYADQTEARVRNVVWRGDWPRELPPVAEQELIGDYPAFLDERLPDLTGVFEHDFSKDGFPQERFSVVEGDQAANFAGEPDGLHVNRVGKKGYANSSVVPRLSIRGDFDITAAYGGFRSTVIKGGDASVILQVKLDNAVTDECLLYRRSTWRNAAIPDENLQSATARFEAGQTVRSFSPNEVFQSTSGSMRLARRRDTIYFLAAEGDSPNFRLVRTAKVTADDVRVDGLRLTAQIHEAGRVDMVWKSLSIRAEQLDGLALEESTQVVAELDTQRAALPMRYVHDFVRDHSSTAPFHRWGFAFPRTPATDGLHVVGRAVDNWTSAGVSPHVGMRGDFDVSFEFNLLRADVPKPTQNSSVYLQVELPVEAKTQASMIFSRRDNGRMYTNAQVRMMNPDGTYTYPSLRTELVTAVRRMRFARRGGVLYFLCSEGGSQPDRLLARLDAPDVEIPPGFIHMLVHTGGVGRITEAAFEKVTIQAEEITGQGTAVEPVPR